MTKKQKKLSRYIEVQQGINDLWHFSICKTRNKKLVMMSSGYPTLGICMHHVRRERSALGLDKEISVVVIKDFKMIAEAR